MGGWAEFVQGSDGGHAVQVYRDVAEFAESVASYLGAGFGAGEPAIVLARRDHITAFANRLAACGWNADDLIGAGMLVVADAAETLGTFSEGGDPNAEAFDRVVGGMLDVAAAGFPDRRPRVVGEMVDVLCQRDELKNAIALEELWNSMQSRRSFSLLCAYRVDVFDIAAQKRELPAICRVHSHVRPAHDVARLARAVDAALEEVLGYAEAGKIYLLVGEQARATRIPIAELALMWISEHMPVTAERVLASTRSRYADAGALAAARA